MCLKQRSEFAAILDVVERAVVAFALRTQAKIRVVFAIESADRQQAEATVVATRNGASSSFTVIRSAISNASAMDWRRARLRITSFHSTPAATGQLENGQGACESCHNWKRSMESRNSEGNRGYGGSNLRDPRPADRRAVSHYTREIIFSIL